MQPWTQHWSRKCLVAGLGIKQDAKRTTTTKKIAGKAAVPDMAQNHILKDFPDISDVANTCSVNNNQYSAGFK